jgi:hypothetical protein
MKLKKVVAVATIVGVLGFGAAGLGGGVASAGPAAPVPMKPGHGHDDPWPPPWQDNNRDNNGPDWQQGGWDKGQWWATNRHDWWDDRNGAPPWGWGPPPPAQWWGAPPWVDAHPFNYWGWNVTPVWDDGFHAWGFWLFGIWIPLVGF